MQANCSGEQTAGVLTEWRAEFLIIDILGLYDYAPGQKGIIKYPK